MKRIYLFLSNLVLTIVFTCNLQAQFNDTIKIDYFGQTPPGNKAVIFAPDFISRENWFVQNCCFSTDGKEFVFVITDNNWAVSDLMYTKFSEGKWSEPVKIFDNALVPAFSYDGNKLYFISNRRNGSKDADIWMSSRNENGWQEPVKVGMPVSSDNGNEWELTISSKGTLYYSSDRSGGKGGMDIYRAALTEGEYTKAENLGIPVNTGSADECPYIAPDESFLVLNDWKSNAKFQGNNLYITYPKNDSSWTNPKDLGFRVNTDKNDIYPYISPDGKYLFYTIRDGGFGALSSRIYWINTVIFDSIQNTNTTPYQRLNILADTVYIGEYFSFKINEGTFIDDDEGDSLAYTAEFSDDEELPEWITFNPQFLTFEGIIPGDFSKKLLKLYIIATDKSNASIKSSFVLFVLNTSGVKKEVDIGSKVEFDSKNNCIRLDLSGMSDKNNCVRIYNISGCLVNNQNSISGNQLEINTSQFRTGIYVINIFNKNQNFSYKIAIY